MLGHHKPKAKKRRTYSGFARHVWFAKRRTRNFLRGLERLVDCVVDYGHGRYNAVVTYYTDWRDQETTYRTFKFAHLTVWLGYDKGGYRYNPKRPRWQLGFYYGTPSRGLIWNRAFTFRHLGTEVSERRSSDTAKSDVPADGGPSAAVVECPPPRNEPASGSNQNHGEGVGSLSQLEGRSEYAERVGKLPDAGVKIMAQNERDKLVLKLGYAKGIEMCAQAFEDMLTSDLPINASSIRAMVDAVRGEAEKQRNIAQEGLGINPEAVVKNDEPKVAVQ